MSNIKKRLQMLLDAGLLKSGLVELAETPGDCLLFAGNVRVFILTKKKAFPCPVRGFWIRLGNTKMFLEAAELEKHSDDEWLLAIHEMKTLQSAKE